MRNKLRYGMRCVVYTFLLIGWGSLGHTQSAEFYYDTFDFADNCGCPDGLDPGCTSQLRQLLAKDLADAKQKFRSICQQELTSDKCGCYKFILETNKREQSGGTRACKMRNAKLYQRTSETMFEKIMRCRE